MFCHSFFVNVHEKMLVETNADESYNILEGGFTMPVTVDKDTCIGCGACVGVCPVSALSLDENGKSECDEAVCISCLSCTGACPVSAISEK